METENLEIQISADNLIVVNDAHLRIVGDKEAAPGDHHTGFENKARRTVDLGDLNSQILTIGSTGIASILPVAWLSHKATQLSTGNLISWTTAQERSNKKFFILKSINAIDFNEVGRLLGKGYSNQIQHYDFLDKSINASNRIYYQIKQVDFEGSYDFSPVFHLILTGSDDRISVFPNPYYNQRSPMTIRVPEKLVGIPAQISVKHVSGIAVAQEAGILEEVARKVAEHLEELSAGIYLIIIESNLKQQVIKWLKEN